MHRTAALVAGHKSPEAQKAENEAIRELVESLLDAEDTTALVRLVFSASPAQPKQPPTEGPDDALQQEDEELVEVEEAPLSAESEPAAVVADLLEDVGQEQQDIITTLCRANAEEMVRALRGLEIMETGSAELHEQLLAHNTELQATGGTFAASLDESHKLQRISGSVNSSKESMEVAVSLLQKCVTASQLAADRRLHAALRLLLSVRAQLSAPATRSDSLPSRVSSSTQRMQRSNGNAPHGSAVHHAQLGKLQPYLAASLQRMLQGVEQAAMADFNDWLVSVRANALNIGLRAMTAAARQRASDHAAARDCRLAQARVLGRSNVSAPVHAQPSAGQQQSALDPAAHPAAVQMLAHAASSQSGDTFEGVDMTLLHRCVHVNELLDKLNTFQEYYQRNRQLQLQSDLQVPADFAGKPQIWLGRIVGFFLVEDRVQRTATALPVSTQVYAGWDSAVACMKAAVERVFEASTSAPAALALKDYCLLVCNALGSCGHMVLPLQEHVMKAVQVYHHHLCSSFAPEVAAAFAADTEAAMQITSASTMAQLTGAMGLPISVADDTSPSALPPSSLRLPVMAPFSALVPKLLGLMRRFVDASYAWTMGLVPGAGETLSTVRGQRDAFVAQVVIPAAQQAVDADPSSAGGDALARSMRFVTNVWALTRGLSALDAYTSFCCRGYSPTEASDAVQWAAAQAGPGPNPRQHKRSNSSGPASAGVTTAHAWQGVQLAAEAVVARLLAQGAKVIIDKAHSLPWLPDQPDRNVAGHSAYVTELLAYLKEMLRLSHERMPQSAAGSLEVAVFESVGTYLTAVLRHEAVPAFNFYGIQRLNNDVAVIQHFANSLPNPNLQNCLAEVAQLCEVIVNRRLDDVATPERRSAKFPALDPATLLAILPKYREVGDKASYTGTHAMGRSKQPESFPKKREVDDAVKRLRAHMKDTDRKRSEMGARPAI